MSSTHDRWRHTAVILVTAATLASAARAGDLYVSGDVGFSAESSEGNGLNTFVSPARSVGGSASDSSPVFGGAVGYQVPLYRVIPLQLSLPEIRLPYWPGRSVRILKRRDEYRLPGWPVRFEIEGRGGRDYELTTQPLFPTTLDYVSEVSSWSLMSNLWMDVPISPPIESLLGRVPILEPITIHGGVGVGVAGIDLETSDGVEGKGSGNTFNFAYQFGAGLGYQLTERVSLGMNWRYIDLGEAEVDIRSLAGTSLGNFALDVTSHEFTSTVRVNFYRLPFLGE